ncbi:hypothetical protein MnTg04_01412 [bacterium MnTg04]|nr:hypothetical protein MnTg04_01412 [bacterium MnTg04]
MVRGDGGSDSLARSQHEVNRVRRGDVFENDPQARKLVGQRRQGLVDKRFFTVEDIDRGVGGLAMHQ